MRERQLVRSIRDGVGSSTVGICTFLPALGIIRVALLPTAFIVAFFFMKAAWFLSEPLTWLSKAKMALYLYHKRTPWNLSSRRELKWIGSSYKSTHSSTIQYIKVHCSTNERPASSMHGSMKHTIKKNANAKMSLPRW
jgi:hypothetical protein